MWQFHGLLNLAMELFKLLQVKCLPDQLGNKHLLSNLESYVILVFNYKIKSKFSKLIMSLLVRKRICSIFRHNRNNFLGPMQPFLAYNLQTDTQTINLVWTLGFLGFLIGSLITSHIFTKYLTNSIKKMSFMSFVMVITGVATLSLPFIFNLPLLLVARFVQVEI